MAVAVVAEKHPDVAAIIDVDGAVTSFAALNASANRLARCLRTKGLVTGDAVALVSPNRSEFVVAMLACYRTGLRITPVNWHQSDEDIAYVVENCEAKALIGCGGRFDSALQLSAKQSAHLQSLIAFNKPVPGFESFEQLLENESGENIDQPVNGNVMLYTSGTTGKPKGVYRERRPLTTALFNTLKASTQFVAGKDVSLITGPIYHAAPLNLNLMQPLEQGVTCVLMDKWDAEQTLQLIDRYKVSYSHMVPTMIQRMLALPDSTKSKYDLSSLRYILHGAAPCPTTVKQAAIDWLGPVIYEYYAATEGGGVFCDSQQWLKKPGTVGKVIEGMAMKLLNDDGEELKQGELGTVYFKKPEVEFSYFKDNDKTAGSYQGDFFTMGDIGYLDEEGFLFLTGRSAELVICGGVNVYPAQIDNVLMQQEAVADVATLGVPNKEFGEEIKALIVLNPGVSASEKTRQSIYDYSNTHLNGFMRPRSIEFVDEIPRSEGGKILRRQLRAKYWPESS